MRRARTLRIAWLLALCTCSKHEAPRPRQPSADSAVTAKAEENRAAQTDEWNLAEVVKRLGEAGLVVTDSGHVVHHAGLTRLGN
ncbi:MAG TPA: hypothetical protein VGJ12_16980, partial [Gemmatimonadaceae bacterium]